MTLAVDLQRIIDSDHEHLVHPLFHPNEQQQPFVWVEGKGATLRSADGREFIDGLSCLWNVNVGHGRTELADAAAAQMRELATYGAFGAFNNQRARELTDRLASLD